MKICLIRPSTFSQKEFRLEAKDEGIPGAEETLINFATTLVSLGALVDVYTQTTEVNTYYENRLKWIPLENLNPSDFFDGLIFWSDTIEDIERYSPSFPQHRRSFVRMVNQMDEKNIYNVADRFDRVLSQSNWFTSKYSALNSKKTIYIPNGIDPICFSNPNIEKVSGRIFYGSDYDRGLVYLLQHWDSLRKINPNLSLHVCYGWDIFDTKLRRCTNQEAALQMQKYKAYIEKLFLQPRVVHLGKISHQDVNRELLEAEYWLYPCTFPENNSTLSLKAQAAKVIPVIIPSGGLDESVYWGFKTVNKVWAKGVPGVELTQKAIVEWTRLAATVIRTDPTLFCKSLTENQSHVFHKHSYARLCSILLGEILS